MNITEIIQQEMGLNDRWCGPARHRGELPLLFSPTLASLIKRDKRKVRKKKGGRK